MRTKKGYKGTALHDTLLNIALGFICLFILAMLNVINQVKKAGIETKAEYVITVSWEKDDPSDVDTWLAQPDGVIIFYRNLHTPLAHLDRDDLGDANDKLTLPTGEVVEFPYNQEILTIRQTVEGEWILNIDLYSKRSTDPSIVTVRIDKLNPAFTTVFLKTFTLSKEHVDMTVTRMTMTRNGNIINWSDLPKKLIKMSLYGNPVPTINGGR